MEKNGSKDFIQIKYSMTQFLYWVTCCSCSGFVAVYLQYKGLSNTMVGSVVSLYCLAALFAQPMTAKMVSYISFLTVKKMILFLLLLTSALFFVITTIQLPVLVIMILFIAINALCSSVNPLMNTLGMEYVNQKRKINFSISRGIGSLGWALSAAFLGLLLEKHTPNILGYVYITAAIVMLIILLTMEDLGHVSENIDVPKHEKGILKLLLSDSLIRWIAVGLFFELVCHSVGTVFTINIVRNVGGSEATAGIAQFFGAGCELLGMIAFSLIIRHMNSVRILKICSLFFVLRFFVLMTAQKIPMVILTYALQGPSTGLYIPAAVYFINDRLSPEKRTQGQSVFYMLSGGLAGCIGSFLGGWLQDRFDLHTALLFCLVFAITGSICILSRSEETEIQM